MVSCGVIASARRRTAIGSAPTFVSQADTTNNGSSTIAVAYPTGIAANDILILAVNTSAPTPSAPSGWNTMDAGHLEVLATTSEGHGLYWKRADGTESGTVTVSLSANTSTGFATGRISAWRGCTTSDPPYERLSVSGQTATTAHRGKGLSTAGINRRVVSMFYGQGNGTTGAPTNGWTEESEGNTTTGTPDSCWSTNTFSQATAGKVQGCQRTMSASVTGTCWTFALVPIGDVAGAADPFAKNLLQVQFAGSNGSTSFTDDSHYNHVVSAVGDAQIQSNKLELDGTGDWATTSATFRTLWQFLKDDFSGPDDFTIDLWNVTVDTVASSQFPISYWDSSAGHANNRGWSFFISTAGHAEFQYSTNGTSTLTLIDNAAGIAASSTHNFRLVRDTGGGNVYLYIDGTKVATAALSAATAFFTSDSPLVIGSIQTQGTATPMDGRMSAVRIRKEALSTGSSYTVETLPLATS